MMIMMVFEKSDRDRLMILDAAHAQAAYLTDEEWTWLESASVTDLMKAVDDQERMDFMCLDVTTDQAIDACETVREKFPSGYMILVADSSMSPVTYMRPSIRAASLMLKPLDKTQVSEVLKETIRAYLRQIDSQDNKDVFVINDRGSRDVIPLSSILFFEAREKKIFLSTESEEYGFAGTLGELEERLSGSFLRCHRSYMANRARIDKIELSRSRLFLDDGTMIPLSRTCKPAVREFINGTGTDNRRDELDIDLR